MGLGGQTGTIRDQPKAAVAPATTQFHWQDPSLSTESSRGEKTICLLLCARGSRFEPWWDQLPQHCDIHEPGRGRHFSMKPKARLKNDNLTGLLRVGVEKRESLERNEVKKERMKE